MKKQYQITGLCFALCGHLAAQYPKIPMPESFQVIFVAPDVNEPEPSASQVDYYVNPSPYNSQQLYWEPSSEIPVESGGGMKVKIKSQPLMISHADGILPIQSRIPSLQGFCQTHPSIPNTVSFHYNEFEKNYFSGKKYRKYRKIRFGRMSKFKVKKMYTNLPVKAKKPTKVRKKMSIK